MRSIWCLVVASFLLGACANVPIDLYSWKNITVQNNIKACIDVGAEGGFAVYGVYHLSPGAQMTFKIGPTLYPGGQATLAVQVRECENGQHLGFAELYIYRSYDGFGLYPKRWIVQYYSRVQSP